MTNRVETRISRAALLRRLSPGTELTMVRSYIGPARKLRQVLSAKPREIAMQCLDAESTGLVSYLSIIPGSIVVTFDEPRPGFAFLDPNDRVNGEPGRVEYEWGLHPTAPEEFNEPAGK